MSYFTTGAALQGFGSTSGLGLDAGCDLAQTFDPAKIGQWIIEQHQNNNNGSGKKYTYWIVAGLWRLGYTVAGFDMSLTDAGYVNWGSAQAAAWQAFHKNRLGTTGGFFPTSGTGPDMVALKQMQSDIQNNVISGPNDPKIVCISGDSAQTINPVVAPTCPEGWGGTPPNCSAPAPTPPGPTPPPTGQKCPTGTTLVGGKCVKPAPKPQGISTMGMVGIGAFALAAVAAAVVIAKKKKAKGKGAPPSLKRVVLPHHPIHRVLHGYHKPAGKTAIVVLPKGQHAETVPLRANRHHRKAKRHTGWRRVW